MDSWVDTLATRSSPPLDIPLLTVPGSRICRVAVNRGWEVTSFSRSGEPSWSAVTSSAERPSWSSSVAWEKADMLKPETYKPLLKGVDAVVHSSGILLEADYKGVITGKESIWQGLSRAFSASKMGSQNPLERKEGEELKAQEKDGQLTYELINRDSGLFIIPPPPRFVRSLTHRSNHPSPRGITRAGGLICVHFCCGRSPVVAQTIHYHQKRCRVHNCFVVP